MTPEASEPPELNQSPRGWSSLRRVVLVGLVLLAHVGFILAFGNYKPTPPQVAPSTDVVNLTLDDNELLTLEDPTLFALPHAQGAASRAWAKPTEIAFVPYRWTEPPRLLPLRAAEIGHFQPSDVTNTLGALVFAEKPAPEALLLQTPAPQFPTVTNSTFRITGALAQRRWLDPPILPSWTNTDLLTNTIVQALVRPDGSVFSATLLIPPGLNERQAAEYALTLTRKAHFETSRDPDMTLGKLIFEWHVTPP